MNSIFKVLASLGLTFGISTLIALLFSNELFWMAWTVTTVLQFAIFYIFNQVYSNKIVRDLELVRVDQIKEANRNLVVVGCPCDENNKQTIDFRFDSDNVFECGKCGKNFRVTSKLATLLTTDPIYFEK